MLQLDFTNRAAAETLLGQPLEEVRAELLKTAEKAGKASANKSSSSSGPSELFPGRRASPGEDAQNPLRGIFRNNGREETWSLKDLSEGARKDFLRKRQEVRDQMKTPLENVSSAGSEESEQEASSLPGSTQRPTKRRKTKEDTPPVFLD